MTTIKVSVAEPYEVLIGSGMLKDSGAIIAQKHALCTAALITDDSVETLYADEVEASLKRAGFKVCRIVFPHGEASKNLTTLGVVLESLASHRLTRSDLIIALGGGVVGDLAGFAAGVYLRGIPFVQIPTTFLAAIDSSVGGKTAVDLKAGKNLAGVFWQPRLVICDCDTLLTLPNEYFLDGMGEAVKYGLAFDDALFALLAGGDITPNLTTVVAQCVKIKADIVAQDERDTSQRQKLNFGHTVGHAIEQCSEFSISHGQAVAIGMVIITRACVKKGLIAQDCLAALYDVLNCCGLPVTCAYDAKALTQAALGDKKRRGNHLTLVLPTKIGECALHEIDVNTLEQWIALGLDTANG